jgi:hypothetical protein
MDILFLPLMAMAMVFIMAPYVALIPAALFFSVYFKSRRWPVLTAAILWCIYSVYESGMMLRILCTGECNIRIDLLVIYPLLIFVSIIAIVSIVLWRKELKHAH